MKYLLVYKVCPESCTGSAICGVGHKRIGSRPDLVDVLENDERLADRVAVVDEDWYHLVNRIHLQ